MRGVAVKAVGVLVVALVVVMAVAGVFRVVSPGSDAAFESGETFAQDPTYVLKASQAAAADPEHARSYQRLSAQPTAKWFGTWVAPEAVADAVRSYVAGGGGAVPVLVLYGLPGVNCHEAGPSGYDAQTYGRWVRQVASGLQGAGKAVVVLEPDALASLGTCSSPEGDRVGVLRDAVEVLAATPNTVTYIDAGHSAWQGVDVMADRLRSVGVDKVRGFALNVSNGRPDEEVRRYGDDLAKELGSAHYIADTSRNGATIAVADWCNPRGAKVGSQPGVIAGQKHSWWPSRSRQDADLWVKPPGESDGTCNGGPAAGEFWPEAARQLAG